MSANNFSFGVTDEGRTAATDDDDDDDDDDTDIRRGRS